MGKKPDIIALSWDEVFNETYTLWEDQKISICLCLGKNQVIYLDFWLFPLSQSLHFIAKLGS